MIVHVDIGPFNSSAGNAFEFVDRDFVDRRFASFVIPTLALSFFMPLSFSRRDQPLASASDRSSELRSLAA